MFIGQLGAVGRLGLTPAKGVGAWVPTLAALKAFLAGNNGADNPHSLPAMASPPTITTSTNISLLSGITGVQARWTVNQSLFQVTPATQELLASTYLRLVSATRSVSVKERGAFKVTAICNAAKVGLQVTGHASVYRFIVDGQYVDMAGTLTSTTGTPHYVLIDFGSKASRRISVEMQGDQGFHAMFVATGDTVDAPPAESWNIDFVGDSFTAATGTGAANNLKGDGYAAVCADYLGIRQRLMSGVGATGYSDTAGATRYKLSERAAADVAGKGPFKVVVVAMGINDNDAPSGVTVDANAAFDIIRAGNPAAVVVVLGPWDKNAPSAAESGYSTCKANIQSAVAGRGGFLFVDVEGVDYEKVGGGDTTHPSTAGHIALGAEVAGLIRAAVAAA